MKKIIYILIAVLFVAGVAYVIMAPSKPGKYDQFAQCLTNSGAKYYGAFWCPNCQNQRALFGRSYKYVPYTECSTPDGQGQLQVCRDAGVTAYPTWIFADGEKVTGTQSLEALSEKTSCPLPNLQ